MSMDNGFVIFYSVYIFYHVDIIYYPISGERVYTQ